MARQPDYIDRLIQALGMRGIASTASLRGCTEEEIRKFEADAGHPLPRAYKEFLSAMGRGAGRWFVGTDFFFPDIVGLTDIAREMVEEDPAMLRLPDDAVVFGMHQGYEFLFFRAGEGDDPPVHHYLEGGGEFLRKADHLSQHLLNAAADSW